MLVFEERENRRTQRKTLQAKARTINKLNPNMTSGPGKSRTHWWKASTLTTALPLLPMVIRDY